MALWKSKILPTPPVDGSAVHGSTPPIYCTKLERNYVSIQMLKDQALRHTRSEVTISREEDILKSVYLLQYLPTAKTIVPYKLEVEK